MVVNSSKIKKTVSLFIVMILTFVSSYLTPYMQDDFWFSNNSFLQIFKNAWGDYLESNGRLFGQIYTRILVSNGKLVSSILVTVIFTIYIYYLCKLTFTFEKDKYNFWRFILLLSAFMLFVPDFGSVVLWRSGAGNYLVTTTIMLAYLDKFIFLSSKRLLSLISLCGLGFLAGFGNQNTSGGVILITLLILLKNWLETKKLNKQQLLSVGFLLLGFSGLLLSPGDKKRAEMYDSQWLQLSTFDKFKSSLKSMILYFINTPLNIVFLILLIIIVLIFYRYFRKSPNFKLGLIFIIAGVATGAVLCLSPEGMNVGRTYFGAFTLSFIGMFRILSLNRGQRVERLISITMLFFFFVYFTYKLPSTLSFNRQLSERYVLIEHSNHKRVKLPAIKYQSNKYTMAGSYIELSKDSNAFPNYVYNAAFEKTVYLK